MRVKTTAALLSSVLLLTACPGKIRAQYQVGQTITEFSLPDLDGRTRSISSYRGKVILLNFFATW